MAFLRYAKLCKFLPQYRLSSLSAISFASNPLYYAQQRRQSTTPATSVNIVSSQCPDLKLVDDKSLPAFLFEKFDSFGDKRAIIDAFSGQEYSYSQLQELAWKFGSALTKLGFKKGDVFAIYCPNIAEYPIIYLAVLSLGGIVTTVSSLATVREICLQMKDSKAKYIITVPPFASNAKEVAEQCGLNEVFVVGEAQGCRPLSYFFQDDGSSFPANVRINPKEDIAAMPYSSGTTGLPKGTMLTHFNIISNIQQLIDGNKHYQCVPDDNVLGLVPFFHIYGLSVVQGIPLYSGASIISLPKFEPEMFLQTLEKYKVSNMFIAPPVVLFLANHPIVEKYDLSSVHDIISAAAPLSEDLSDRAAARFKGINHIRQGYGLTETIVLSMEPLAKHKGGTVGTLIPNTEVKIVHMDTGEALGENEEGEIYVRGPQVMKGYLNNPQLTKEVIDSDGWLHTGDVGYYDSDNFFRIVDRCKELIKYKGFQVAPAEIEAVLIAHPKILDAAVIGVPDESAGEIPKAYIVSSSGISREEINAYVENSLASYKKLRGGIEFVDEIPKSNTGKILRQVLTDR